MGRSARPESSAFRRAQSTVLEFDSTSGAFLGEVFDPSAVAFPRGFVFQDDTLFIGNGSNPSTGEGDDSILVIENTVVGTFFDTSDLEQFSPLDVILSPDGSEVGLVAPMTAAAIVVLGIVPLAAGIAGYLRGPLSRSWRAVLLVAAALLFYPGAGFSLVNFAGLILFLIVAAKQFKAERRAT